MLCFHALLQVWQAKHLEMHREFGFASDEIHFSKN